MMRKNKGANFDKRKNPTSFSDEHFALVDMQENVNITLILLLSMLLVNMIIPL